MSDILFVTSTLGKQNGTRPLHLPMAMNRFEGRIDDLLPKDNMLCLNWENHNWPKQGLWIPEKELLTTVNRRMKKAKVAGVDAFVRGSKGGRGPTHRIRAAEVGETISLPSYCDPSLVRLANDVWDTFGGRGIYNLGIFNCRHIAGSSSWSQHAYIPARAIDIGVGNDKALGDDVNRFIKAHAKDYGGICELLWWIIDHYDHNHAVVCPRHSGTPGCA